QTGVPAGMAESEMSAARAGPELPARCCSATAATAPMVEIPLPVSSVREEPPVTRGCSAAAAPAGPGGQSFSGTGGKGGDGGSALLIGDGGNGGTGATAGVGGTAGTGGFLFGLDGINGSP
ncbi:hypothetical protein OSJ04_09060, partial [Mycobacterium ulcerans]